MFHVQLHQVIDHIYFCSQMVNFGSYHHKLENGEQVIHAPYDLVAHGSLDCLWNKASVMFHAIWWQQMTNYLKTTQIKLDYIQKLVT